jgi:DNA primase
MPGIDFEAVKNAIPMTHVLELIGWEPASRTGPQLRGRCPIHQSTSKNPRTFSVDIDQDRFQCFKCEAQGNQLDLWAKLHSLKLFDAAKDLCEKTGTEIPWVQRW